MPLIDAAQNLLLISGLWDAFIPHLEKFITIPSLSPEWNKDGKTNHLTSKAVTVITDWANSQKAYIRGLDVTLIEITGRSPTIHMQIPSTGVMGSLLFYSHFDKQPPFKGWSEGLAPYTPVRRGDRLYGRGGADDGYASFAALSIVRALQEQGIPHPQIDILIEGSEESGSPDLPAYLKDMESKIGTPNLVVCLDTSCGDYRRPWLTTSLRGVVGGDLRVEVLEKGMHSGQAGGIAPSSALALYSLISRVVDLETQVVKLPGLQIAIPPKAFDYARANARILGRSIVDELRLVDGARPLGDGDLSETGLAEILLNGTLRPSVEIIGQEGIPSNTAEKPEDRPSNVLRPFTTNRISVRIPPGVDPEKAFGLLKAAFEKDVPSGMKASFTKTSVAPGWMARPMSNLLESALTAAANATFGVEAVAGMGDQKIDYVGRPTGGTIPFAQMVATAFPDAEMLATGVLGPGSNAHGPDEFLDIEYGKKVTAFVAMAIAQYFNS